CQAEDGIRDFHVTGVQTCALPIWLQSGGEWDGLTRVETGAAQGKPWLVWESPRTLAEVAVDVNKTSNNVMTRQLLLQVAADVMQIGRASCRAKRRAAGARHAERAT